MEKAQDVKKQLGITLKQAQELLQLSNNSEDQAIRLFYMCNANYNLIQTPQILINTETDTQRSTDLTTQQISNYKEVSFDYIQEVKQKNIEHCLMKPDEEEICVICLYEFSQEDEGQIIQLSRCSDHFFHKECIDQQRGNHDFLKCPTCGIVYGILTGDMPQGSLQIEYHQPGQLPCTDYENYGTYLLHYSFPNGVRQGQRYRGTERVSFIPDTDEGRQVVNLLILCFERRLTFTIGTSVTTGRSNCVIWNGVHHKTNIEGGPQSFGYPDPTYFSRVKEELAAKGIYSFKV